jgi:hypothetical protein
MRGIERQAIEPPLLAQFQQLEKCEHFIFSGNICTDSAVRILLILPQFGKNWF